MSAAAAAAVAVTANCRWIGLSLALPPVLRAANEVSKSNFKRFSRGRKVGKVGNYRARARFIPVSDWKSVKPYIRNEVSCQALLFGGGGN